jgi:hypothetical protein
VIPPRPPSRTRRPVAWTNVVKLLAAAESVSASKHVRRLLINGCVGDGAGAEFNSFLETQDLPDPEDILADPQTLAVAPSRAIWPSPSSGASWPVSKPRTTTSTAGNAAAMCSSRPGPQNKEVAMAGYGRLWKIKPNGYAPPKRNGVFAEMDSLRNG